MESYIREDSFRLKEDGGYGSVRVAKTTPNFWEFTRGRLSEIGGTEIPNSESVLVKLIQFDNHDNDKNEDTVHEIKNETNVLKHLNDSNTRCPMISNHIPAYYGCFTGEEEGTEYCRIIMEHIYYPGSKSRPRGDMGIVKDEIKEKPRDIIDFLCPDSLHPSHPHRETQYFIFKSILEPLARILVDFHDCGFAHGDLNMNNVLLGKTDNKPLGVFLIDFGRTKQRKYDFDYTSTFSNTTLDGYRYSDLLYYWIDPYLVKKLYVVENVNFEDLCICDWWGFAMMCLYVMSGQNPYSNFKSDEMPYKDEYDEYVRYIEETVTKIFNENKLEDDEDIDLIYDIVDAVLQRKGLYKIRQIIVNVKSKKRERK